MQFIIVYVTHEYRLEAMDKEVPYYFTIEAINENGVSLQTPVQKAD